MLMFFNAFYYLDRITGHNSVWFNIFIDYATGSNNSTVANIHASQNAGISSYPYIVSNGYRTGISRLVSLIGVNIMACSIQTNIRTYKTIITNSYFGIIQHHTIISRIKIISDMYITPKIAVESC